MEEINGFVVVDFTDHEFAKFLNDQNPNWSWDSIAEYNKFIIDQVVIAIVKYKNDYPVARKIWVNKNLIEGYVIVKQQHPTKLHKEEEKAYCQYYSYPHHATPNSVIYEDERGTYWLKSDLKKEYDDPCPD